MLFVWGTRRVARKLGTVADFCPICREIRAFKLSRIGMAGHIYYISVGSGKLVGHEIECTTCGVRLSADPLRYSTPDRDKSTNIDTLVHRTFPNVREAYADRLAMEQRFKRTPGILTAEQRAAFLIEPFRLLNPGMEERYKGSTKLDKQSGIGCLGTIVLSAVILAVGLSLKESIRNQFAMAAGVVLALGALYTFVQLALGPGRYLRTKVLPPLARALDPLEPTEIELAACLEKCKSAGMKIGQKLKIQPLWAELRRRAALLPSP